MVTANVNEHRTLKMGVFRTGFADMLCPYKGGICNA